MVKQALVLAHELHDYRPILYHCHGVSFFGRNQPIIALPDMGLIFLHRHSAQRVELHVHAEHE